MKKKILLSVLVCFFVSFITNFAYAQKTRYVLTKSIDANGVEYKENRVKYFTFENNNNKITPDNRNFDCSFVMYGSNVVYFKYDHKENGNLVYYGYIMDSGVGIRPAIHNNILFAYIVASPDLCVLNFVNADLTTGQPTMRLVYKKQAEPSKGTLYR